MNQNSILQERKEWHPIGSVEIIYINELMNE